MLSNNSFASKSFDATALEEKCVHQVYEEIAEEFSNTRYAPWPGVMRFLSTLPDGALGADVGCGNGKYLLAASQTSEQQRYQPKEGSPTRFPKLAPLLALDRCKALTDIVHSRGFDVVLGDILALPYLPGRLDFFICIATLHHLSTVERRVAGLQQLAEVLRPGGVGLIQVWAFEQTDITKGSGQGSNAKYIQPNKEVPKQSDAVEVVPGVALPVHITRTPFTTSDMLVPWNKKQVGKQSAAEGTQDPNIQGRYYHLFVESELDNLVHQVPSLEIQSSFYEQGNWAVVVCKKEVDC